MSTKSQKLVWAMAISGSVGFVALLVYVAFHADAYARQINSYSRIVHFLAWRVTFSAVGMFLVFCAVVTTFQSLRLILSGFLSQGTVVGYEFEEDCYLPIVEFIDRSGAPRRFTSSSGSGKKPYPEGRCVMILYDPTKPEDAAIRAFWTLWLYPLVLSAFAVLFLVTGFGILDHGK